MGVKMGPFLVSYGIMRVFLKVAELDFCLSTILFDTYRKTRSATTAKVLSKLTMPNLILKHTFTPEDCCKRSFKLPLYLRHC